MGSRWRLLAALPLALVLALAGVSLACAASQPPVNLGACASYGVFSQHVLNNTGTSTIIGDLGLAPGGHPLPTGLVVSGAITTTTAAPLTAMQAAYADAMSRSWDHTITADLGGRTLLPGVYRDEFLPPDTIDINGTLTLDAQGDPDAVWVFQSDYDLVMGPNGRIVLANGARFCRVFWAVRNASLAAGSHVEGHILAAGQIDAADGATVRGQLLSLGGVTTAGDGLINLTNNRIDNSAYVCGPTPRLPKTGYPPQKTSLPWQVLAGVLVASAIALPVLRRRVSQAS